MYWNIASLVLFGLWLGIICEIGYHGYHMYKLWLDDKSMSSHRISYDPFLDNKYGNDIADYLMSVLMIRGLLGFIVPIAVAAIWPIMLCVVALVLLAKHHKRVRKLQKGVQL